MFTLFSCIVIIIIICNSCGVIILRLNAVCVLFFHSRSVARRISLYFGIFSPSSSKRKFEMVLCFSLPVELESHGTRTVTRKPNERFFFLSLSLSQVMLQKYIYCCHRILSYFCSETLYFC